jgi:hypothetical protein
MVEVVMQAQQEMVDQQEMVEVLDLGNQCIMLGELVETQGEIQVYGEGLLTLLVEMEEQAQRMGEMDQIEMGTSPSTLHMEDREVVVVDLDLLEVPDLREH